MKKNIWVSIPRGLGSSSIKLVSLSYHTDWTISCFRENIEFQSHILVITHPCIFCIIIKWLHIWWFWKTPFQKMNSRLQILQKNNRSICFHAISKHPFKGERTTHKLQNVNEFIFDKLEWPPQCYRNTIQIDLFSCNIQAPP